jgi:hypothetical protein
MPDPEPTIAALRVAFVYAMMFHNPVNQFRHVFATFGSGDLAGVRRFMFRVLLGLTGIMLLLAGTPLCTLLLHRVLGIEGEVLHMARQSVLVLCLVPFVVALRNYFHGLALVDRRTTSMGAGAICRNLAVTVAAALLSAFGLLNHVWAPLALVAGFTAETVVVVVARRRGEGEGDT